MPVYFAQARDGGPVKTGYSRKPAVRVADISHAVRTKLLVLAVADGDMAYERSLHERFSAYRASGVSPLAAPTEWYEPCEELAQIVSSFGGTVVGPLCPKRESDEHASDGALQFRAWLRDQNYTNADAASEIGYSAGAVSEIVRGVKLPSEFTAEIIAAWTRGVVPLESWLTTGGKRTTECLISIRGTGANSEAMAKRIALARRRLAVYRNEFSFANSEAA